jgi:hypothetical protein
MNSTAFRNMLASLAFLTVLSGGSGHAEVAHVTPRGHWLAEQLDEMGVETKWIAGVHVNWETGLPDGIEETAEGRHTHCSAFVAAAAYRLGVYILRPPQHRQTLLANAQNEWLAEEGRLHGWRQLRGPLEAQLAADRGEFVVASYHNHREDKPGHIAIVRPAEKSSETIAAEGPTVIQAGTVNSDSISLKAGFAGHPYAWNDDEIVYYTHELGVPAPSSDLGSKAMASGDANHG